MGVTACMWVHGAMSIVYMWVHDVMAAVSKSVHDVGLATCKRSQFLAGILGDHDTLWPQLLL